MYVLELTKLDRQTIQEEYCYLLLTYSCKSKMYHVKKTIPRGRVTSKGAQVQGDK